MFKLFASPSALLLLACSEATASGNIAVIGGVNLDGPINSIEIIAEASTKAVWKEQLKTPLTVPRSSVAAAVLEGTLYAIGGLKDNDEAVKTCEELDTTNSGGVWSPCLDLQMARYGHAAAAHAGKVYAIGGFTPKPQGTGFNNLTRGQSLEVLDTTATKKEWVYGAPLSIVRSWAAAVLLPVSGKLYAIGGKDHAGVTTSSVEVLDTSILWVKGSESGGWVYLKNDNNKVLLNTPRFGHAAAEYKGKIYVTGGVNTNEFAVQSLEFLDTNAQPLEFLDTNPQLQIQRQIHASAFIGGMLIVMGGSTQESGYALAASTDTIGSVEMLDVEKMSSTGAAWVLGTPLINMRQGIAAVAFTVTDPPTVESVTTAARAIAGQIDGIDVEKDSVTVETVDEDVIVKLTLKGDLAAFSKDDFVKALAKKLGVPEEWITLSVKAGSIVVTATVHNPDAVTVANTDCVVIWQPCNTNCLRLSDTTTEQSGTGSACPQTDPEPACVDGEGRCVIDASSQVSDASHANLALVFFMVVMTSLQLVCY